LHDTAALPSAALGCIRILVSRYGAPYRWHEGVFCRLAVPNQARRGLADPYPRARQVLAQPLVVLGEPPELELGHGLFVRTGVHGGGLCWAGGAGCLVVVRREPTGSQGVGGWASGVQRLQSGVYEKSAEDEEAWCSRRINARGEERVGRRRATQGAQRGFSLGQ